MAKEISIPKMYASEEIPCMLFDCSEDADEFDTILREYVNTKDALLEFDKAERKYASIGAVAYNIRNLTFHFNIEGEYSDRLIAAAENMVDTFGEDLENGDCYTPVMNYIFMKLHPNYVND